MNPRTRRAALYAIGAIAILASANALAHSYAGLYDWAVHHQLTGWQAMSWPAEIDVFLAVGELALYVAYLDGWPGGHRIWPWATALIGLAVSVAGNIGHIQARPAAAARCDRDLPGRCRTRRKAQPASPGPAAAPAWSPVPERAPAPDRHQHRSSARQRRMTEAVKERGTWHAGPQLLGCTPGR